MPEPADPRVAAVAAALAANNDWAYEYEYTAPEEWMREAEAAVAALDAYDREHGPYVPSDPNVIVEWDSAGRDEDEQLATKIAHFAMTLLNDLSPSVSSTLGGSNE